MLTSYSRTDLPLNSLLIHRATIIKCKIQDKVHHLKKSQKNPKQLNFIGMVNESPSAVH